MFNPLTYESMIPYPTNAIIPDTGAIDMARQYNKPTVDNRRALRSLSGASDRLHQQMVDEQYR